MLSFWSPTPGCEAPSNVDSVMSARVFSRLLILPEPRLFPFLPSSHCGAAVFSSFHALLSALFTRLFPRQFFHFSSSSFLFFPFINFHSSLSQLFCPFPSPFPGIFGFGSDHYSYSTKTVTKTAVGLPAPLSLRQWCHHQPQSGVTVTRGSILEVNRAMAMKLLVVGAEKELEDFLEMCEAAKRQVKINIISSHEAVPAVTKLQASANTHGSALEADA